MFCRSCGKELPNNAEFCSGCGTKVIVETTQVAGRPGGADIRKSNPKANLGDYSVGNVVGNRIREDKSDQIRVYFKFAGVFAGILAFISLFMDWAKVSSSALAMLGEALLGEDGSYNFFDLTVADGGGILAVLMVLSIALVVIFQLINHPSLSRIGCAFMVFMVYICIETIDSVPYYKYAFGSKLFIFATVVACVATFAPKKRKSR